MVVNRELKIFTRFKQFWMGQGIKDPTDPKFQWILQNNPDSVLFKEPWRGKLIPADRSVPLAQVIKAQDVQTNPDGSAMVDFRYSTLRGVLPFTRVFPLRDNGPALVKTSIIIISHDRPEFLKQAVESLLNQTDKNLEVILLECSSRPEPIEYLKTVIDDRLRIFNAESDNISQLWNLGIDIARGEYIGMLDDDNHKRPQFVEKMAGFLDIHPECSAVGCQFVTIDVSGTKYGQPWPNIARFDPVKEIGQNYIDSGCLLFRKSLIEKIGYFDERLWTNEDYDFILRMVRQGHTIGWISEALLEYRQHLVRRMTDDKNLGRDRDIGAIRNKSFSEKYHFLVIDYPDDHVTPSQRDSVDGIISAIRTFPNADVQVNRCKQIEIGRKYDYIFVPFPMNLQDNILKMLIDTKDPVVTIHIEEPASFNSVSRKIAGAHAVVVNDKSVAKHYEDIVGQGNVYVWNNLSVNTEKLGSVLLETKERDIDVLFLGHPYPSRMAFTKEVISYIMTSDIKIRCVGSGYERAVSHRDMTSPTVSDIEAMKLMQRSKIVVVRDREQTDLPSSPDIAENVHRGYFECASGAVVLVRNPNRLHSFRNEVGFFDKSIEAVELIKKYLADPEARTRIGDIAKARALKDWTFDARIHKIISGLISRRLGMVID